MLGALGSSTWICGAVICGYVICGELVWGTVICGALFILSLLFSDAVFLFDSARIEGKMDGNKLFNVLRIVSSMLVWLTGNVVFATSELTMVCGSSACCAADKAARVVLRDVGA